MRSKQQKEQQVAFFKERRAEIERILRVMNHVTEEGVTESTACYLEGVDHAKFRRLLRCDFSAGAHPEKGRVPSVQSCCTWQERFIFDAFGDTAYVLPDFEEAYEAFLAVLPERTQKVVRLRYEEEMTLDEIGKKIGTQRERARQILAKALRQARHPRRAGMFRYGMEWKQEDDRLREAMVEKEKKIAEVRAKQIVVIRETKDIGENAPGKVLAEELPIEDLCLSRRCYTCLRRAEIRNVQALAALTGREIRRIRNLGTKSIMEIGEKLDEIGVPHEDWA